VSLYWPDHPFRSEASRDRRRLSRWAEAEKAAARTLLLSHGNCLDGVASAIVTLRALGRDGVGVAYAQPSQVKEFLEWLVPVAAKGRQLLIADLSLQKPEFDAVVAAAARLKANGWRIAWRDHHHKQWEGLALDRLRASLDVLQVNADATESGATLQQQALAPADPFARRLAETVRDRDLWWNKTPDSETLEFALAWARTDAFVDAYLAAKPDDPVVLPAIAAAAQAERDRQAAIRDRLLAGARRYGDGKTAVSVVYGNLPKNTGLHELLERGAQLAINVRPNGKASLRSRKEAAVCHLVAQRFSGGGHPNASGADLGLKGLAYWWYVVRRGKVDRVEQMAKAAVAALESA
jgi:oligoribonuclease NrnB/cAMP/cGMP phosphodiesterase (DHH superfamily)